MSVQFRWLILFSLALSGYWASTAAAQTTSITFRDDFDAFHDYTTGAVPASGIWSGVYNATNGGGLVEANGVVPGSLYFDDLNNHPNNPGAIRPFGIGWESGLQGTRWNNGPFVFRDIPSEVDFTATIKIDTQTAGNWSYAAIIARHKGPTVGIDEGGFLDPDESFLTTGNFPGLPDEGIRNILTQNIVNTVEFEPPLALTATAGAFPIWVRMTKNGNSLTCSSSADGLTFIDHHTVVNAELNQPGETVEIGVAYMQFGAENRPTQQGNAAFDFFEVTLTYVNDPPLANAGPDQTVDCESPQGAVVTLDGSLSSDPNNDDLDYEWSVSLSSGAVIADPTAEVTTGQFPIGVHQVTLTVYDLDEDGNRMGGVSVDTMTVTVVDDHPPLATVAANTTALWPPNHQMEPVIITVQASDSCTNPENLFVTCTITSSQPDNGNGDGDTAGDVNGQDGYTAPVLVTLVHQGGGVYSATVELRAERAGGDKAGRIYSIDAVVGDVSGNTTNASTTVVVPHSQKKNN